MSMTVKDARTLLARLIALDDLERALVVYRCMEAKRQMDALRSEQ